MSDYVTANRERNVRIIASRAELSMRRKEAWADKSPDHIDLQPPSDFVDPASGRRALGPDPHLVELGRYLRRARRYADKTQQRLANETGVSQSMVSRAERALAPSMRLERLLMLCDGLGRLFPLGTCPHDHECAWQPVKPPPERQKTAVELLVELLQNPEAYAAPDPADETADKPIDEPTGEPLISVTLADLAVGVLTSPPDSNEIL